MDDPQTRYGSRWPLTDKNGTFRVTPASGRVAAQAGRYGRVYFGRVRKLTGQRVEDG